MAVQRPLVGEADGASSGSAFGVALTLPRSQVCEPLQGCELLQGFQREA